MITGEGVFVTITLGLALLAAIALMSNAESVTRPGVLKHAWAGLLMQGAVFVTLLLAGLRVWGKI